MPREALLLSIRPRFVSRILDGTKSIELRRVPPCVVPGDAVVIYASAPTMALVAVARVGAVEIATPRTLWRSVKADAGITREEYDLYFEGATRAAAISLVDVEALTRTIPLDEIRRRWPWLRPPQSYRYVQAAQDGNGRLHLAGRS